MAPTTIDPPSLWTPKDVCRFLRISKTTLWRLAKTPRKKGGPPTVYIRNRMRFPRDELIEWAMSRRN